MTGPSGEALAFGKAASFPLRRLKLWQNPQLDGQVSLAFELLDSDKPAFEELTGQLVGKRIGIFFEGELITGPLRINSPLPGGGILQGPGIEGWSMAEALALADRMWGGAGS